MRVPERWKRAARVLSSYCRPLAATRRYPNGQHILPEVIAPDGNRWRECLARIREIEQYVQQAERRRGTQPERPVLFLIASSHITHFSLGAGIGLLASWAVRLAGCPVVYHVCKRGMSQCVLGSNRQGLFSDPPCDRCIAMRDLVYPPSHTVPLAGAPERRPPVRARLETLSWPELTAYRQGGLDLGRLCLPSLRWIQRRYLLEPDDFTRRMLIEYIVSAAGVAGEVADLLDRLHPRAVVLSNGTHYPEAVARHVAAARGIPVVTYETGFGNVAAFFSHDIATEYAIRIPDDFRMGPREDRQLDTLLTKRFRGNFGMAGRRIWSDMKGVPPQLHDRIQMHRQAVTIFTNVTWDTSQAYANAFFDHMFDWLDATLEQAARRPDTLFIIRAHPDELRKGAPNESVGGWLEARRYLQLPNVVFVRPEEVISSYELITLSKCCITYHSTVGLEAAVLGSYVLCGGRPRYRHAHVCHDPGSRDDYCVTLRRLLEAEAPLSPPAEWRANARRYFYFSLFKASLDLSRFLEVARAHHFVVRSFHGGELAPARSREMRIIVDGILHGRSFHYH